MHIQECKQLKFRSQNFYPLNSQQENPISFLYLFFHDAYPYIQREGVCEYIKNLDDKKEALIDYNMVNVIINNNKNLIYLSEGYYLYKNKIITPEIDLLLEQENFVQLCQIGFLEYACMKKENFIHLIVSWDKIWNQKEIEFILLYLDDQNWYDVLPFDSQEAMENFVADHTKIEDPK